MTGISAPVVRPYLWSLRRELWENRSLTVAPAAVAAIVLLGFLLSVFRSSHFPAPVPAPIAFMSAEGIITATGWWVAALYCLSALYGERRDRSILFWKSLPVSDSTTVLAKMTVPVVVVPLVTILTILATHVVMAAVCAGLGRFWGDVDLGLLWPALVYASVLSALWHAPVFAWLLLVSGWARRRPVLWALVPLIVPAIIERLAFGTAYVGHYLNQRLFGGFGSAVVAADDGTMGFHRFSQFDLVGDLTSAGLWIGLIVTALLLAAAIWRRRRGEPI